MHHMCMLPSQCRLQYYVEVASRSSGDWDAIPRFIGAASGTSKDAFYARLARTPEASLPHTTQLVTIAFRQAASTNSSQNQALKGDAISTGAVGAVEAVHTAGGGGDAAGASAAAPSAGAEATTAAHAKAPIMSADAVAVASGTAKGGDDQHGGSSGAGNSGSSGDAGSSAAVMAGRADVTDEFLVSVRLGGERARAFACDPQHRHLKLLVRLIVWHYASCSMHSCSRLVSSVCTVC